MSDPHDIEGLRKSIRDFIGKKSPRWIRAKIHPAAEFARGTWTDGVKCWDGPFVDEVCAEEAERAIAAYKPKPKKEPA